MALSWESFKSVEGQQILPVNIDYFEQEDINITIDDIPLPKEGYIFESRNTIHLKTPLEADRTVYLYRSTDNTKMRVNFSQGAPFFREQLDEAYEQLLLLAQEVIEGVSVANFRKNLDMNHLRIFNLADPILDQDATTKRYVDKALKDIYDRLMVLISDNLRQIQNIIKSIGKANVMQYEEVLTLAIETDVFDLKATDISTMELHLNGVLQILGESYTYTTDSEGTTVYLTEQVPAGTVIDATTYTLKQDQKKILEHEKVLELDDE
ncbi:phage tail fiber protein [Rickettsiella endosymbiont of Dermanyssus gallinae]|uniref:phage tail fiber domain-containing protein n=1 Tax=Rickettsiella endosymbiont of Dermanyssus gallinae TaxID=2856608 RepID=UPI001C53316B|nr:phage tail fiber protein [Rickettsiella endosymbiont of Dermanyssus gallinae]